MNAFVGSGIALWALALTLALNIPPRWFPDMPQWALHSLVMLAVFLFLLGALLIFLGLNPTWSISNPKRTAIFALIVFMMLQSLGLLLPIISDENLQSSFQLSKAAGDITVTSSITNNGQKSDRLVGFGLFLIQTHYDRGDEPIGYLDLCGTVDTLVMVTQQFLPGYGVGGDKLLTSFFSPSKISSDGKEWNGRNPIPIAPNSSKEIEASYKLPDPDFAKYNTYILCPMVAVLDERGSPKIAICPGAMSASPNPGQLRGGKSTATFRILPRAAKETVCKPVSR